MPWSGTRTKWPKPLDAGNIQTPNSKRSAPGPHAVRCALQRFVRGPLQGARGVLALAALLVAGGLGARADEPVTLEKPGDALRASSDTAAGALAVPMAASKGAATARAPSFFPKLTTPPLDPPLTINGGFGEYRPGHFHAGVDLGTDERVGKVVRAPLAGSIVRVRTSGVGYGRSLYLEARDGRLLQFGHLDAFVEPLGAYVAAAQESSGQYEQDLWIE